ncbi:type II toxin-antitoxin system VapC family toxin [Ammonifex thiophilus]|uniref:Type II toxin-antitoxin system VapC family toxin n=1 Tax=Ammonifex thiophilus TaxID=444093 RepID=A0A3D8P2E6_9THEO|nr:type II toxin-antitoxin system VapC family toxin [Ammonifex thiophilus]RDV80486.1 type II toxin-antitoxin system VapC family toxin [Ammonifex thiophilus]
MKILLDTHVFLWWIADDPRLPERVRKVIANKRNTLFFSAASAWEMAIKASLGKLSVPGDLSDFVIEQLRLNNITPLPVRLTHALRIYSLPRIHRDPFDRLLVAQAQEEGLVILTNDAKIREYPVEVVWL